VTACVICNQLKGAYVFDTIPEAEAKIREWRAQMRAFWEQRVKPLLPAA